MYRQIQDALTGEREDLLKRDLLSRIRPNFAFFPAVERRAGHTTDIIELQMRGEDAALAAPLRRLLGRQWRKIRLAKSGQRVVVLVGSNPAVLEQAISRPE